MSDNHPANQHPKQFTSIVQKKGGIDISRGANIMGYLRVGDPKEEGQKVKTNEFFRLDSEIDDLVEYFTATYGDEPNNIPIYFPTTDREFIQTWQFEAWKDKRKLGYSNGAVHMVYDHKANDFMPCEVGSDLHNTVPKKLWLEYLTIRFCIANMPEGIFGFKTSGKDTTIPKILASLQIAEMTMNGFENQLFYLNVKKSKQSNTPGSNIIYPIITIRSAYTAEQKLLIKQAFTDGTLNRDELFTYLQLDEVLAAKGKPRLAASELKQLKG